MREPRELGADRVTEVADLNDEGEVVDVVSVEACEHGLAGRSEQDEAAYAVGLCVRLYSSRVPIAVATETRLEGEV